ncbi:D-hexose-6-phosphate mutarotase [Alteromonas sp. LMIT006]|jgi:glucose-6-phosphate 1-epimerase|uniref:D-hexose-6-phosphate mutarotase n=1 Tax=Alteromonadaceae TaxID=72275 RepID=UPI0020CA77E1|nr:D-hexose-6-phosphate mutarotase [Alteromonas sp. LMIT006]UTP72424.1 D-hexose-6-phosphate mutarotase [Alteromonas sp. LMIT006]
MNTLTLRTSSASCQIALHGAHLTSYVRNGLERLFVSQQAVMDGTKAIRGGVPICWPWFGQLHADIASHKIAHGLVRNQPWDIIAQTYSAEESSVTLVPSDTHHPLWPSGLSCSIKITLGEVLEIRLISSNSSAKPIALTGALHTYFAIPDIVDIELEGFEQAHQYIDNNTTTRHDFGENPYLINDEVDRVHLLPAPSTKIVSDSPITIKHRGHDSLVVWNPGAAKAKALADLADKEYRQFVCIETALTQGFELIPGNTHELIQSID